MKVVGTAHGGSSSGYASLVWWLTSGVPLVLPRVRSADDDSVSRGRSEQDWEAPRAIRLENTRQRTVSSGGDLCTIRSTADGRRLTGLGLRAPRCRERHQQCRGDRGWRGQLGIMSVSCAQTTVPAHCSRSAGERGDTDERTASEVPCWRRAAVGLRCVPVDRPLRRPGAGTVAPRRFPARRGIPFGRSSVGSRGSRAPDRRDPAAVASCRVGP